MPNRIVLVGNSRFAEIALEYLEFDSEYIVVASTIDRDHITKDRFYYMPVIPFDEIEKHYDPNEYRMLTAIGNNAVRERFYIEGKKKGYSFISYISSKAFVWRNSKIGENNFIFEDNTIQPFVEIGNNNVFWSGNHIGHHSTIGSNNFISSHVVICGGVNLGNNCFLGVNSSIINDTDVPDLTFVKAGEIYK